MKMTAREAMSIGWLAGLITGLIVLAVISLLAAGLGQFVSFFWAFAGYAGLAGALAGGSGGWLGWAISHSQPEKRHRPAWFGACGGFIGSALLLLWVLSVGWD